MGTIKTILLFHVLYFERKNKCVNEGQEDIVNLLTIDIFSISWRLSSVNES